MIDGLPKGLLDEVQVAHLLSFTSFAKFSRAITNGHVPRPDKIIGKERRWKQETIERFLDPPKPGPTSTQLIQRLAKEA